MLYEKEIKEDEKENKNMQNKIKRENQKTESMIINELNTVNNKTKEKNFLIYLNFQNYVMLKIKIIILIILIILKKKRYIQLKIN